MVKLLQKTNGTGDPAPGIESVYCENYEPAADILAALDAAVETGEDVELPERCIVRRAAVADAAVHTLRAATEIVYVNRRGSNWHAVARFDRKPVGSVEFTFGRPFHGELSARVFGALETLYGRPGAASHLHGPLLRPGETCEKIAPAVATLDHRHNRTQTTWVRHRGLWFSAWHGSTVHRRAAVIDAASPAPGPGGASPKIAIA